MNHHCHWPLCKEVVAPKLWGCPTHWYSLPQIIRDEIWEAYRPGQEIDKKPSTRYLEVARMAETWIMKTRPGLKRLLDERRGLTAPRGKKEEGKMQKQEMTAIVTNGLKSSVHALEIQVTLLKRIMAGNEADDSDDDIGEEEDAPVAKKTKSKKAAKEEIEEEDEDEVEFDDAEAGEDDAPVAKKKGKKAAAVEEEEEEEEEEEDEDESEEEEEEEEAPKKSAKGKKGKAPKLTVDDVNDACKARVLKQIKTGMTGPEARKFVLKLMKTHHETSSIQDLDPADFADVIETLNTKKK